MSDEIWKPIPGYEGFYEASNQGRVMSASRVVKCRSGGLRTIPGAIIKPSSAGNGYVSFALCREGKKVRKTVHRAVCEAFHGLPQNGQVVRHLNGDPSDNRADNLKWGTQAENSDDALLHGTRVSKLTDGQVAKIKQGLLTGVKGVKLAADFGVSGALVSAIGRNRIWRHVSVV